MKKATWIKTKNITSTPLLLTFKEKEPPTFIQIPREQAKTKVYEYYQRPMSCKKCLRYGHTLKRCHETIATYAMCTCQVHQRRIQMLQLRRWLPSILKRLPNIQERNRNHSGQSKRTHTQISSHTKTSRSKPTSWINLPKHSEEHL